MQRALQRRKPQKWVELVISCSVPRKERADKLLELRGMYRRRLEWKGEKAARKMARREAYYWIKEVWPERILKIFLLLRQFIGS